MHTLYPIILFYRDINNIIFRIFIAIRNIFRKIYLHWFFVIKKSEKGYGEVVKRKKPWKHNQTIQLSRFWRRERDSNPWTANAVNGFRDRPVRPLRHLSLKTILSQRGDFHPFAFAKIQLIFQLLKFISIFYPSSSISYCFSD